MTEKISLYSSEQKADARTSAIQRKVAVEAALELIRSAALGGSLTSGLAPEMRNLPEYADIIQYSLEPKAEKK